MDLLGANGKPIRSERKVTLQVIILDQKAGESGAERSALGFELESNDPLKIADLLRTVNQSIVFRLNDIGFLDREPGGVDIEEGKDDE